MVVVAVVVVLAAEWVVDIELKLADLVLPELTRIVSTNLSEFQFVGLVFQHHLSSLLILIVRLKLVRKIYR